MRVLLFGATGMIGAGVLLECLDDPRIDAVVSVVRGASGRTHAKLTEIVHDDFLDYVPICAEFAQIDACFFCLGVSSAGMQESEYRRITRDVTLAAAKEVLAESPDCCFVYVSGAGTDATGRGRSMWARVKGETEQALLAMGFERAFMFRPGYIQPQRGVRSRTALYRAIYAVAAPLFPLLRAIAPNAVTTTVDVGRAMIEVSRAGYPRVVLETPDINRLARQYDANRGAAT